MKKKKKKKTRKKFINISCGAGPLMMMMMIRSFMMMMTGLAVHRLTVLARFHALYVRSRHGTSAPRSRAGNHDRSAGPC